MQRLRIPHDGSTTATGVWLVLAGLLAGVLNGLLGAGGGVVIVLLLTALRRRSSSRQSSAPEAASSRDIFATALCCMLPISALSAWRYVGNPTLQPQAFAPFLLPAIVGGIAGGLLLDRLQVPLLRRLFALLLLITGARMVLR